MHTSKRFVLSMDLGHNENPAKLRRVKLQMYIFNRFYECERQKSVFLAVMPRIHTQHSALSRSRHSAKKIRAISINGQEYIHLARGHTLYIIARLRYSLLASF